MKEMFTKQEVIKALTKWYEVYLEAENRAYKKRDFEDTKRWVGKQVTLESVARELGYDLEKRKEIEEQ